MTSEIIAAIGTALTALIVTLTGMVTVLVSLRKQSLAQEAILRKQDVVLEKVEVVRLHVNHEQGVVLQLRLDSALTLATLHPQNETYEQLAKDAEAAVAEHVRQQAVVDAAESAKADQSVSP